MKTVRFTAYPDGYRCSESGDQSGEYVKKSEAKALVEAIADIFKQAMRDQDEAANRKIEEMLTP